MKNKLSLILLKIKKNEFLMSSATLISGNIFASAITVAAIPVLTRLYTPEDFGALATFISLTLIISTAAGFRFDIAIPTASSEKDAVNLLVASITLSAATSIITFFILFLINKSSNPIGGVENITLYAALVSVGIFLASTYNAMQFWATRQSEFRAIAKTRASQSVIGISLQILAGATLNQGSLGLILGQILSASAGIVTLYKKTVTKKIRKTKIEYDKIKETLTKFSDYPKYSTAEALFNSAATQAPIIIISTLYLGAEAGFLLLAMRLMQAPMSLIGSSIGQVYLSQAPAKNEEGKLAEFTSSVLFGLLRTGVGPIIFCGILAPSVCSFIFGDEWRRVGVLMAWMTPWLVIQFVTSPLAMSLHITKNQKTALVLQFLGLIIRPGTTLLAIFFAEDLISEVYAISGVVFYLIYFVVIVKKIRVPFSEINIQIKSASPFILAWIVAAIIASIAFGEVIKK